MSDLPDFAQILGQDSTKFALQIALAGNHPCLVAGEVGVGKSMLLRAARGLVEGVQVVDDLPNRIDAFRSSTPARAALLSGAAPLLMAMRPSAAGKFADSFEHDPEAALAQVAYARRIPTPLLERIAIHTEALSLVQEDYSPDIQRQSSKHYREQIAAARARQEKRQGRYNAQLSLIALQERNPLSEDTKALLLRARIYHDLSPRGMQQVLSIARTVADLDGEDLIGVHQMAVGITLHAPNPRLFQPPVKYTAEELAEVIQRQVVQIVDPTDGPACARAAVAAILDRMADNWSGSCS